MTKDKGDTPSLASRLIGALVGLLAAFVFLLSVAPAAHPVVWAGAILLGGLSGWFFGLWIVELFSFIA